MGVGGVEDGSDLELGVGGLGHVRVVAAQVVHKEGEGLAPHLVRELFKVRRELNLVHRFRVELNID